MRIVFFGTSAFGIPFLEALKKDSHEIVLCVTTLDKPQGRNLKTQASPIKRWAQDHSVPFLEVSEVQSAGFLDKIRKLEADFFVVISFGLILPKALLEIPRLMALNVHSSLLPRYRGAAPIHWALINGEKETGVTVMRMAEKLDAGDSAVQKKTDILPRDDIYSLEERLGGLGAEALLEALVQIQKGTVRFTPQAESQVSYARKLGKRDGRLDWATKASAIRNRVRAMKEWPTSYTFYEGKRLILEEVGVDESQRLKGLPPGVILSASRETGIWVAAADFPVEIRTLKLEGRGALAARDFLNGFPLKSGQSFE